MLGLPRRNWPSFSLKFGSSAGMPVKKGGWGSLRLGRVGAGGVEGVGAGVGGGGGGCCCELILSIREVKNVICCSMRLKRSCSCTSGSVSSN